jgi:hypothetical protein
LPPGTTVTVGAAQRVGSLIGIDDSGAEPLVVIRQRNFVQKFPERGCHVVGIRGMSLSALLIGRLNVFEHEITGHEIVGTQGEPLQDVLKVSRFCRAQDNERFSALLAAGGDLPDELEAAQPKLVVFDGSAALRRWRETWRGAPWLVVLDRTSPAFDEGVALVEAEYVQRNSPAGTPDVPTVPGTEVMAFWTSR